ncbi:MAG: 6-carboxytetrahydropterin synthase [Candidatus Hydrothermales bacterium]
MSFILKYKKSFRARHHLLSYKGAPEEPHYHNYTLIVSIETNKKNKEGYTIDFMEIKNFIDELVPYENEDLNLKYPFLTSTENLAEYFFKEIAKIFSIKEVELWQDENFCVIYRK